jgi:hypothetical protein
MSRGGARKGSGRKPVPYKKQNWMLRIQPQHARFIARVAKANHIPIGDLVAASVLWATKQKVFTPPSPK